MKNYLMEFIGTMFLVISIGLSVNNPMAPIVIGLMLSALIYMGGHVSGAHYNPAITIAIWIRGKIKAKEIFPYVVAQALGAFLGALICHYLRGESFAPMPGPEVTAMQAILVEVLFTFVLASVILGVATTKKLEGNYIYGFAIGFTVTACAFCGGGISGGVFNPAVGIGPIIMDELTGGASSGNLYLYLSGPFVGAILAAFTFRVLNPEDIN